MAVSYISQKCTSCASTRFKYLKDENMWECLYCGTKIERHEQADSLFTIKNVVRQALIDIAWKRYDSARDDLIECEKIDSRYVGTIIVQLAYNYNQLFYGGLPKNQQNNTIAKLKNDLRVLRSISERPDDTELALYDFLDSSEAAGVLILVYDALKEYKRSELMFEYYDPCKVYSMHLNSQLIIYSIKRSRFDIFDRIIENENIDVKKVFNIILKHYPCTENKAMNARKLIEALSSSGDRVNDLIEGYIASSSDTPEVKCDICLAAEGTDSFPSFDSVSSILMQLGRCERSDRLVGVFSERKMLDTELYKLIGFAFSNCDELLCFNILQKLSSSENYVQLNYEHLYSLLSNEHMTPEGKIKIFSIAKDMNVTDKVKDKCVDAYLNEINDSEEARRKIVPALLECTDMLSVNTIEKYILTTGADPDFKTETVRKMFSKDIPIVLFRDTLGKYLTETDDLYKIKYDIIDIMIKKGIKSDIKSFIYFLSKGIFDSEKYINIMYKLKESGLDMNELYHQYVTGIDARKFNSAVHAAMIECITAVRDQALIRYILWLEDSPPAKVGYSSKLAAMSMNKPENIICSVMYNGSQIVCNLLQGYFFTAREDVTVASAILSNLGADKRSFSYNISVNGAKTDFFKFIHGRNSNISSKTAELASMCGLS